MRRVNIEKAGARLKSLFVLWYPETVISKTDRQTFAFLFFDGGLFREAGSWKGWGLLKARGMTSWKGGTRRMKAVIEMQTIKGEL